VRSLLRWTSLVASGVALYAAGARRLHLYDFSAFLLTTLALAAGIVVVFLATRDPAPPPGPRDTVPPRVGS
jgi:hypothetical protein